MNTSTHQSNQKFSSMIKGIILFLSTIAFFSFQPGTENSGTYTPVIRKQLVMNQPYHDIRIDGNINIVLTNEPANTLTIEGKEKEVNKVYHAVKNDALIVNVQRKNFYSEMTIYMSAINIRSITVNGDAVINSTDIINVNDLRFSLNGHASMNIKTSGKLKVDSPYEYDLFHVSYFLEK